MPGCAAVGCNNRSEKGYLMKCFPRDPRLRKLWQERVARADWEPSNNSFLCHVHFKPQEWIITKSGRIRLKKNAVPSIFTVTSTRKSPKKRKKLTNNKKDNIRGESNIDYIENDTEVSSTGHFEEKDSDCRDVEETTNKSSYQRHKKFLANDKPNDRILVISDTNYMEVDNLLKENNFIILRNTNDKGSNQPLVGQGCMNNETASITVKAEIKPEAIEQNDLDDGYDEIEERLKQICDGGPLNHNDEHIKRRMDLSSTERNPMSNYSKSTKNEISHILDKRENVEIIFGAESGDDSPFIPAAVISNDHTMNLDEMIAKEEGKVFIEDIEENFGKDEVHVIPNMRAAMKRKRRTREEIMKSIKKSIGSGSDQELNTLSNSEISDNTTDKDTETGRTFTKKCRRMEYKEGLDCEGIKFTIKVSGDPEDVTDVIEELSSKTVGRHDLQNLENCKKNLENDSFVTSVITIQEFPIKLSANSAEEIDDCYTSDIKENRMWQNEPSAISCCSRTRLSPNIHERSINFDEINTIDSPQRYMRRSIGHSKERNLDLEIISRPKDVDTANGFRFQEYDELQQRIKVQEKVIEKLTDQLIVYKNMENSLRSRNVDLHSTMKEADNLSHRLNTRSISQATNSSKKSLESKQRLIEDLSNRVNYLEEMNKKLMKTVTLESQQRRKLEGQLKQRDNRIKELNWKLEKASKYLERAEKNTNTYRRKMINMQTVLRRKKVLDEKMTRFSEMLVDGNKREHSEKCFATAMEIRKACGRNGYNTLLSCGFPLPPLRSLPRRYLCNDASDSVQGKEAAPRRNAARKTHSTSVEQNIKKEIDEAKDSNVAESDVKDAEFEGAETVTGTVQDIFEENNDGDDFSTNELREHFILQLNAVM